VSRYQRARNQLSGFPQRLERFLIGHSENLSLDAVNALTGRW